MGGEEKQVSISKRIVQKFRNQSTKKKLIPLGLIATFGAAAFIAFPNGCHGNKLRLSISETHIAQIESDDIDSAFQEPTADDFELELDDFESVDEQSFEETEDENEVAVQEENEEDDENADEEDSYGDDDSSPSAEVTAYTPKKYSTGFSGENFLPSAQITPMNPNSLVNLRTSSCSYFCQLALGEGYHLHRTAASFFRNPPELMILGYKKYPTFAKLNSIVNHVGRGSSCIGGGKGRQLSCRQDLARKHGCKFEDLHIQPPQWNLQKTQECRIFFDFASRPENSDKIWIVKPGGSYHGRGITIHDDVEKLRKKFYNCDRTLADGMIVQEYIKSPALWNGRKFDFRSYLLIASTSPFVVFYHDGFVRRASGTYSTDKASLSDPLKQVTNDEKQTSEDHFFGFRELEEALGKEKFDREKFRKHAMRVTNYLFHTSREDLRGLIPTKGRFQVFALDWMVDGNGDFHLLEGNGNPLVTHYPNTDDLTPGLWTSLIQLEKALHTNPESLGSLSVEEGFHLEGWNLVYNQIEAEAKGEEFDACKINDYEDHPLYSYDQFK